MDCEWKGPVGLETMFMVQIKDKGIVILNVYTQELNMNQQL